MGVGTWSTGGLEPERCRRTPAKGLPPMTEGWGALGSTMSWVIEPRAGGGLARAWAPILARPDASPAMPAMALVLTPSIAGTPKAPRPVATRATRSEEHTSELQSLMRISYAVFCLKKKHNNKH